MVSSRGYPCNVRCHLLSKIPPVSAHLLPAVARVIDPIEAVLEIEKGSVQLRYPMSCQNHELRIKRSTLLSSPLPHSATRSQPSSHRYSLTVLAVRLHPPFPSQSAWLIACRGRACCSLTHIWRVCRLHRRAYELLHQLWQQ